MKTLQISAPGSDPRWSDEPIPRPLDHQVQIKIDATALNYADLLMIEGRYQETPPFPLVPGMEIAGVITARGSGVTSHAVGDRVAALIGHGGLAEFAVIDADRALGLPTAINTATAAAFQITYATAHLALARRARLKKGETLVVLGAAGGAGFAAVEIGHALGAKVIAVARGSDRLEVARRAGADHALDSSDPAFSENLVALAPFDAVYDAVGGVDGTAAARHLRPEGRHVLIGFASGDLPVLKPNHLLVKNIDVIGFNISAYAKFNPSALSDSLRTLLDWHGAGRIQPHIGHTFPLGEAVQALDLLKSRKATGKIVITQ